MQLLKNIWSPKSVGIVFITIQDSEVLFSAQLAGRKTKEYGSFEELSAAIKTVGSSKGFHLHVQGQGVLTRLTESLPNFKEQLVIGGNSGDFYFTTYNDGVSVAASFVRRSVLEKIRTEFAENKWHLLGISSGEIPLCALEENGSYIGSQKIEMAEGKIKLLERNTSPNVKNYPAEIGAAIAKQYGYPKEEFNFEVQTDALSNFKEFVQFKTLGLSLLFGLLSALLGNYFYQNYLNQNIAQLEMDLALSNENLSLLDRLEQEKTRKEQLVASAGVTSPRFLAYYLDEIGLTVPKSIDLQEMLLFPLDGKLKNKHKIVIQSDRILIQGTSPDNVTLDDWIELMDRFEWVKSIELLHYGKVAEKQSEFKLVITIVS